MLGRAESDGSIVDTISNILPKKLGREDILSSLPKLGYQPVMSDQAQAADAKDLLPLYYTSEQIILFPPITDNPNNSKNQLRGIQEIFTRAIEANPTLLTDKNLLLFPLCEEWNVAFKPRQQWVLLVYVNAEKKFYLLDPTKSNFPTYRATRYESNLSYIKEALTTTFFTTLGNCSFVPSYLGFQPDLDAISGGHWVLYFIHRLTSGATIKHLEELYEQRSVLQIEEVKRDLEKKFSEVSESSTPIRQDVTPVPIPVVDIQKIEHDYTPQHTKQDFAKTNRAERPALVRSLVSVGPHVDFNFERSISIRLPANHTFTLKLYSFLIFAGAATVLLALLCLGSTSPILSATVATGIFAAGVVMFVGGALGKCGLFGRSSSQLSGDRVSDTGHNFVSSRT